MSSSSKKRQKSKHKLDSNGDPRVGPPPLVSLNSLMEPPRDLFPSSEDFVRLTIVVAIALLVTVGCNFLVSKLMNGRTEPYCDSIVDSSDSIPDSCEPCPSNGECYQGKLQCLHGYTKRGRLCIEDGLLNEAAEKLSELLQFHICKAHAQFLCDGTGPVWVEEDDIWNDLHKQNIMERFESDNTTMMLAKLRAMEKACRLLEVRTNSYGVKEMKCPGLLVGHYKPFTCRIRHWFSKHAFIILAVFSLLAGLMTLLWRVRWRMQLLSRAEELYDEVCEILEETAVMSKREKDECEPWVVASWVRDRLLLPRERKDPALWRKVEELVQEDSRVDRYPKVVKGEPKVVWEWQGITGVSFSVPPVYHSYR